MKFIEVTQRDTSRPSGERVKVSIAVDAISAVEQEWSGTMYGYGCAIWVGGTYYRVEEKYEGVMKAITQGDYKTKEERRVGLGET